VRTLIKSGMVLIDNNEWVETDIDIVDGKIDYIGKVEDVYIFDEVINAKGKLVIPGLINSHAHSYTGLLKGTIENTPLDIYMLYAIAGGAQRTDREIYISTLVDCIQMLKTGTTSVVDHFSQRPRQELHGIDSVIKAFIDSGMRASITPMFSDKPYFDTIPLEEGEFPKDLRGNKITNPQSPEDFIEVCERTINKWHNFSNRIKITLGTDGPQRCSEKLLELTRDLEAKYKIGWHTHVLEAKTQAIMSHKLYGKGLIEYINDMEMLNERTSLVHFIWVSEKEIDLVINHGATVVHCPNSGLHIGSGVSPVLKIIKKGGNVAIGTDGGNLGHLSMFERLRLAALLQKVADQDYENWLASSDILSISQRGGAKVMKMDGEIGSLKDGMRADVLILDIQNPLWQPPGSLTHQLVYNETGSSVDTVLVEGRTVVKSKKIVGINEEDIYCEASEIREKMIRDNKDAFLLVKKQLPYLRKMYLRNISEDIKINRFLDI
jgi:cytosine/adenosine deaminase-related metal-dependent hydrolase